MSNEPISDHQNFLDHLINTVRELTNILSREITLLETSRPGELQNLLPLKNKLIATYHQDMSELSNHGGLQASGNGPAIRLLKQETRLFQKTLTHHKRLVGALKKISENMIRAISDEVVRTQNRVNHYGADGSESARKSPTSISLNQTI